MNPLTYMAFGGGTQSMAMLILAAEGKIPRPDVVLFADTKGEPAWVYDQVAWAASFALGHGMPFHKVERDDGIEEQIDYALNGDVSRIDNPPFYISAQYADAGPLWRHPEDPDRYFDSEYYDEVDKDGVALRCPDDDGWEIVGSRVAVRKGNAMQKCTRHWKARCMESWIAKARAKDQPVIAQIGLSADEVGRMKAGGEKPYIRFSYPLIELGMRRGDSIRLVEERAGFTPKRSACRFCPWHSDAYWQMLKDDHPDEFEKAARFEDKARNLKGRVGIEGEPFLHPSRKPLREVDFVGWRDTPGQMLMFERDQFGNECGGYCGV